MTFAPAKSIAFDVTSQWAATTASLPAHTDERSPLYLAAMLIAACVVFYIVLRSGGGDD